MRSQYECVIPIVESTWPDLGTGTVESTVPQRWTVPTQLPTIESDTEFSSVSIALETGTIANTAVEFTTNSMTNVSFDSTSQANSLNSPTGSLETRPDSHWTTDLSQVSTEGATAESTVWRTTTSTNDITVIDNISTELPVSELPVTEFPITEAPASDTTTPLTTDSVTVTVPTASSMVPNITTSIQSSTAASTVKETTTQRNSTTEIMTTESPSPRAISIRDEIHLHGLAWNVELSNTDSAEYLGNVNLLQNDLRIILQCPDNCDFSNIQFSDGMSDMMSNRAMEGTIAKYGVKTETILNDEQVVAMYNEKFESFTNFAVLLLIAEEDVQQKSAISLDNLGENLNDAEKNSGEHFDSHFLLGKTSV